MVHLLESVMNQTENLVWTDLGIWTKNVKVNSMNSICDKFDVNL